MGKRLAMSGPGLAIALVIALACWGWAAPPAGAMATCRQANGHEVCIQRIKRSAKRYWEYKARVSIDGEQRPMELYDCRDRLRLPADGTIVPYWQDEAVDVVCALFRRRALMRQPMPKALGE